LELFQARKPLNFGEEILRKVERDEARQATKILDRLDGILLEEDHLELLKTLQSADLEDTIAFQPNGSNVLEALEILNFAESLVMQVESIIQSGSCILPILFTELLKVPLCNHILSVLILVHSSLAWFLRRSAVKLKVWHTLFEFLLKFV